jgi:hypothetical protein
MTLVEKIYNAIHEWGSDNKVAVDQLVLDDRIKKSADSVRWRLRDDGSLRLEIYGELWDEADDQM